MRYELKYINDFIYAVDKETKPSSNQLCFYPSIDSGVIFHYDKGEIWNPDLCQVVVATTDPSLNLPLLPAVEEDLNTPAFEYVKNQSQELKNKHPLIPRMLSSAWKAGYEAASAKQFTEEDMVNLALFLRKKESEVNYEKSKITHIQWANDFIQSLKAKPVAVELEIKLYCIKDYKTCDGMNDIFSQCVNCNYIPAVENNYVKVKEWIWK